MERRREGMERKREEGKGGGKGRAVGKQENQRNRKQEGGRKERKQKTRGGEGRGKENQGEGRKGRKRKLIEKVGTEVPAQAQSWMPTERFDAWSYNCLAKGLVLNE